MIIRLIILLFSMMLATPAQADIPTSFKSDALSKSYTLPCDQQAAKRKANIAPAYFPGRPAEFTNEWHALVVYSPHLTAQQRKKAETLFKSVPAYALPLAWRGGAVYVFTRRGLVEAVPALGVEREWFKDIGLYMEVERRLYLPFEKGEGLRMKRDGKYVAQRYVASTREPFRIINHETGHMVDSLLGAYSIDGIGDDGKYRLSNRADFMAAFNVDLTSLTSKGGPLTAPQIKKLGYYMPPTFNGRRLGIQATEQRARREVFAELWAEAHGHGKSKLNIAYPETFALVKSFIAFLKAQDEAAALHCY